MKKINWKSLAEEVGSLRDGGEFGSREYAKRAIELLISEEQIREAVDYYISGVPGSELVRSIIWLIHPISAMEYCYEIYKSDADIETKRLAIELLKVAADERALKWVKEFLNDPDRGIQLWGFSILDQLLWSNLVYEEGIELLKYAESLKIEHLKESIEFVNNYLSNREKEEKVLEKYFDEDQKTP